MACFPVVVTSASQPLAATETERRELAALVERQLVAERAASASDAAERRAADTNGFAFQARRDMYALWPFPSPIDEACRA